MGTGSMRTLKKSQRGKWHDGAGVGASNGSEGNKKSRTQHYNQQLDNEGLGVKAVKQLDVHQPMQMKLLCVNQR
jgi:hypothetical protein